ncbi:hypothetical protein EJB05_24119, partial [Eragrostis curvula]
MELATAAVASLLPERRDLKLLKHQADLHNNLIPHDDVELLTRELTSIHAALVRASEPPRRLDGRAKAWARNARELAYDVEDAVDALAMSRTADPPLSVRLEQLLRRAADLSTARPQLVGAPPATVDNPQGQSLFELGESYFNELVNRSLIQLLNIDYADDGGREEYGCRVPFPVMDLINSLLREENLVTVPDDEEQTCSPSDKPVRRLSFRGGSEAENSASPAITSVPQLRSLSVFNSSPIAATIDLTRCEFLRVLVLEGCDLRPESHHHILKHLGSLTHLRYLGLRGTRLGARVPEEIGNLGCLQVLDMAGTMVDELPTSVVRLVRLTCLRVDDCTRMPSGIGSLTALEELSEVSTHLSPDVVRELRRLPKLRVLRIRLWKPDQATDDALAESLRKLGKIRTLDVYVTGGDARHELDAVRERWTPPPRCLREFRAETKSSRWSPLRRLPAWVEAWTVPRLAVLLVQVTELRLRDVDALGRLPTLGTLRVEPRATPEPLAVATSAFPGLTECRLRGSCLAPVFRRGAAPRLRRLELCFRVRDTVDLAGNGGFEFGLGNLASLEEVTVSVGCQDSTAEEADRGRGMGVEARRG